MQHWLGDLGAKRSELIYLNVDTDALDEGKMRDTSRIDAGAPILVYAGYLAEGTWHDPLNIWQVFASFRTHCPGAKLTVITKSNHGVLKQHLVEHGFSKLIDAITFTSAASPSETVKMLQDCDVSVFGYRTPKNAEELALAEPVFATKTAEYLCAGLPVIVNDICGGARAYVQEKNAGIAYNADTLLSAEDTASVLRQSRDRQSISATACSDFSLTMNAARLVEHYKELIEPPVLPNPHQVKSTTAPAGKTN
jgi:glycosyltransferase involved in cell wall biosynthesis